jgi:hypothetical protein
VGSREIYLSIFFYNLEDIVDFEGMSVTPYFPKIYLAEVFHYICKGLGFKPDLVISLIHFKGEIANH